MLLKKGVKTKIVGIIKNLKTLRFKVSFFVILNIEGLGFKRLVLAIKF
jgi:hypothetical protein